MTTAMDCAERGCVLPGVAGGYCRHHAQMLAVRPTGTMPDRWEPGYCKLCLDEIPPRTGRDRPREYCCGKHAATATWRLRGKKTPRRDVLQDLYVTQNLSIAAIAKLYGCTKTPVRDALFTAHIPRRRYTSKGGGAL